MVFGSSVWKTTAPSGDQWTGRFALSDSYSNSSTPELSARLRYRPHLLRREAKTISDPSGDQTGDEFSCEASNVSRDVVPRVVSVIQMSPPSPSWRCAATRLPSGERTTP